MSGDTYPEERALAVLYFGPNVQLKEMTYKLPSGGTFKMLRPSHLPDHYMYVGRNTHVVEHQAIWDYHKQFAISAP